KLGRQRQRAAVLHGRRCVFRDGHCTRSQVTHSRSRLPTREARRLAPGIADPHSPVMIFDRPSLPTIPVHDLTDRAPGTAIPALAALESPRMHDLIAVGHRTYPSWLLNFGDRRSRRWLARQNNPYLG